MQAHVIAFMVTASLLLAAAEASSQAGTAAGAFSSAAAARFGGLQRRLRFDMKSCSGDDCDFSDFGFSTFGADEGDEGGEGDEGNRGGSKKEGSQSSFSSKTTSSTVSSSSSCSSRSSTQTYSSATDAHVTALAAAFADACKPGYSGALDTLKDSFKTKSAVAVASAIAGASADCQSSGQGFGCARASSSARAWAAASASANAGAVAEALGGCGPCKGSEAEVNAAAQNFADSFVALSAEAVADAEGKVCVRGDQALSFEAFTSCHTEAYAKVFARASAYALIEGKCLTEEASTKARADTKADSEKTETCDVNADTSD